MSEETTSQSNEISIGESKKESSLPKNIYLVSYPKVVFLYPTFIAAIVAGIYMLVARDAHGVERHDTEVVATIFLLLGGVNLVVLAFDFPRTTSLTLFFFAAVLSQSCSSAVYIMCRPVC